jgi:hypothetical protein
MLLGDQVFKKDRGKTIAASTLNWNLLLRGIRFL